jgi:hypothetical protein
MPDTPANNELLTKIFERFDQLDKKFTGEIRQLDQKLTSEIQAARMESREFHDASKETWKHLERVLVNAAQKAAAYEEKKGSAMAGTSKDGIGNLGWHPAHN